MKNEPKDEPLVSICIPVYNSEKTIRKTINSIINQTYKNLEIIIIDNSSSDSTREIIQGYHDPRITVILNDIHLPCAEYNWNRCFQYVTGEYMAIFHADDVYSSEMIASQVETFKNIPSLGGVFTLGNKINENDEIIGTFILPPNISSSTPYGYNEILPTILEYGDFLPTPTAMIPTNIYKKLAPFRFDQFGNASDLDLWLRAAEVKPIIILEKKLFNYRISNSSGSFIIHHLRIDEAHWFKVIDYHISRENINNPDIPSISINIYELHRLDDILIRANNYLSRRDIKGVVTQIKKAKLITYFQIPIEHPYLIKWICSDFFKIFQLFIAALLLILFGTRKNKIAI